jgi:hypothetical protein
MEQERSQLQHEIKCHRAKQGREQAMAPDVQWQIMEDDNGLLWFPQASHNIAAAIALLRSLPVTATPKEHKTQRDIRELLERAAEQQAESLRSQRRRLDAIPHASTGRDMADTSVHQPSPGARPADVPPIQERVSSIRDAHVILDAHGHEREDRQWGANHGYHPHHSERYDTSEDRSPSPSSTGASGFWPAHPPCTIPPAVPCTNQRTQVLRGIKPRPLA